MAGRDIIEERDPEYKDSWKETSAAVIELTIRDKAIWHSDFLFPWIMILNKLIRAMFTPSKKDNWLDISGYAELVLREMESWEE